MDTAEREEKILSCRFCMISDCFSGIFCNFSPNCVQYPQVFALFQIFGVQAFQFGQDESAVLANQHIIKPDFAAAVFRGHNQD